MNEMAAPPVFTVELNLPPPTKWEREYRAFQRLLPELLQTHRGQYVAVHEERVVGAGAEKLAVLLQAYAKYGHMPIFVSMVAEKPRLERIPHYRVVRE